MKEWKLVIYIWSFFIPFLIFFQTIAGMAVILEKKETGKNKFLGIALLYRKKEFFLLPIKSAVMKRAETTEYVIEFRKKFVDKNYMEELIVKISDFKISCRIDDQVTFSIKDRRLI